MGLRNEGKNLRLPANAQGMCTALEFALAFHDWASAQVQAVTHEMIKARWGVSRATAYRWLAAWRATQERRAA